MRSFCMTLFQISEFKNTPFWKAYLKFKEMKWEYNLKYVLLDYVKVFLEGKKGYIGPTFLM